MDYIAQNPDLDLQAFFKGRGVRLSSSDTKEDSTKPTRFAPPPKDSYWVAAPEIDDDNRSEEN